MVTKTLFGWALAIGLAGLAVGQTSAVQVDEAVLVAPERAGTVLGAVSVSRTSFNPAVGQRVSLRFHLEQDAQVSVSVLGPDRDQVVTISDPEPKRAGGQTVEWDGRDANGNVVPDEAYHFIIRASAVDGAIEVYDPVAFSGGVEADLPSAAIDGDAGTISYRLPQMGRVRIRLGIEGGPLLRTLVDWLPRPAGQVVEYWDGKDKDSLFDLANHPRFKMIISHFDLPSTSVIAFGNKAMDYLAYRRESSGVIVPRPERIIAPGQPVSRHFGLTRRRDHSPEVTMLFSGTTERDEDGTPRLKGRNLVKVALDSESKPTFQDTKFEIVFFVDGDFYAEEEVGYSPYAWVWDTSQIDEGFYVLTVNLSGFGDQVGVLSQRVRVVR